MIRRFLGAAVAAAFLVACGRSSGPAVPMLPGVVPAQGAHVVPQIRHQELPEPPVVRSVNGVAKFQLVAQDNKLTGGPAFWYQGQNDVAPTIEVNPGDTIVIELTNNLPKSPPPGVSAMPEMAMDGVQPDTGLSQDINLHFHGLGASPRRPADDVLTMLAKPGQKLHYVVHVPGNQEPGLYWYHAHVHGQTNWQVGRNGMSGAILIEGLEHHLPGLARMKHRIIIVRATGGLGGARPDRSNKTPCSFNDGTTTALNGVVVPTITIAPGEKQFFRLINATGHRTLKLEVDGERLELVAVDGFALDTYPGTPPTKSLPYIIVPPAARAEFVVTGPADGHAKFRTACYDTGPNGDPDPPKLLANLLAPQRSRSIAPQSEPLRAGAPLPRNVYTTQLPPPAAKRVVIFSESQKPKFFINGKSFSPKAPPMFVVRTGTTEEWHVENVTQEIHDFHIHQVHFVVESINGVKLTHPYWADSVVIPHRYSAGGKTVPGTLVLLMDFLDPTIKGEFLFHCHILDHEDQGMMAKIEAI